MYVPIVQASREITGVISEGEAIQDFENLRYFSCMFLLFKQA